MASSVIQLTALSLLPANLLAFHRPIAHRRIRRRWDGRRVAVFSRPPSNKDSLLALNEKAESDGDGGDSTSPGMTSASNDDQHLLLDDGHGDDFDNDMGMERNTEIILDDYDSIAIDNIWEDALQPPPSNANARRSRATQKNPRMQMFLYLSRPIVEVRIIGLVAVSCFLQAIDTLDDLPSVAHRSIHAIDDVFVFIFAVEFFLRWWSAGRFQLRYLAKPLVSIDAIVVILPLFLRGIVPLWDFVQMFGLIPYASPPGWLLSFSVNSGSALLNLRFLRLLKFQRVLTDGNTYGNFQTALGMRKTDVRPYQLQIARTVTSVFTLVSVSTGLIYTAEHEVNPQIPDYFTALYFGLTTLTTVGFGDITPQTFEGRLVVGGSILAGVAIIPAQAAGLAQAFLDFQNEKSIGKQRPVANAKMRTCESCGAGPHRKDASFCWSCGEELD